MTSPINQPAAPTTTTPARAAGAVQPAAPQTAPAAVAPQPTVAKDQGAVQAKDRTEAAAKAMSKGGWEDAAASAASALLSLTPFGMLGSVTDWVKSFMKSEHDANKAFLKSMDGKLDDESLAFLKNLDKHGKLGAIDKDWGNLRDAVNGALTDGVSKDTLSAVLKQLAHTDEIEQSRPNTCTAATLQKSIAEANPAEYLKVLDSLDKTGRAKLPDGRELVVSDKNLQAIKEANLPTDKRLSAMFQAAAMDFGNDGANYDIKTDTSAAVKPGVCEQYSGLNIEQSRKLNQALLGTPTVDQNALKSYLDDAVKAAQKDGKPTSVLNVIMDGIKQQYQAAKDKGAPGIFVSIHSGEDIPEVNGRKMYAEAQDTYHMMMLKSVNDDGSVTLLDATGKERIEPQQQFANEVSMSNEANDCGGIGGWGGTTTTQGSGTWGGTSTGWPK